ncbi:unnamed protein product [Coccothraustes coccothraustes]
MWRGAAGAVLLRALRPPSWLMRQDSSGKSSSAFTDPCREFELVSCGGKGRNLAFSPVRDVAEDGVRTADLNRAAHGWWRVNRGTSWCNAWSLGTARLEAQVLRWCPGAAGSAPSPCVSPSAAVPEGHGGSGASRCQGLLPHPRSSRQARPAPGKSAASIPGPGPRWARAGRSTGGIRQHRCRGLRPAPPGPEPGVMRAKPCRAVPGSAGRGGAGPRCRAP